ncbi:MarR family winged helix-turn-helix transcriptional regulator [Roseitranquillus sediminis]|uniref:MarR family winged helix-turn-helix transcriptional regulator n=1 Tax=Roseitranquillus sediminis TaxID=2809051 RepID=UPI001D0CC8AD|nr:MarR family transcriptional regulator [Roseitranquillus sediminis]MBM9596245.1 MarR family transcriptional regulator [Roseitranquillus sediminis]
MTEADFELRDFLPFLLNQAAEEVSLGFAQVYKARYGMLRTEWRVLAHLGSRGPMTASDIAASAKVHKTKISRAVSALETRRFLSRTTVETDRRRELLRLTDMGKAAFDDLVATARAYDRDVARQFTTEEQAVLRRCLARLAGL